MPGHSVTPRVLATWRAVCLLADALARAKSGDPRARALRGGLWSVALVRLRRALTVAALREGLDIGVILAGELRRGGRGRSRAVDASLPAAGRPTVDRR